MVIRKTKFSISIEKLQIEFEGSQELGQQIHQGVTQALGGLMNTQARLLAVRDGPGSVINGEVLDAGHGSQATPDGDGDKAKQPRQRRTKGGPSIGALLAGLKQEKFFAQPRTGAEILARLKDKGHNSRQSTVLTELQRMVQKDELFREYNGEDVYVYKDTPFHEDRRSPVPADQPAQ